MFPMTLNPFAPLRELQREMSRLLDGDGPLLPGGAWAQMPAFPALNVWEDGNSLFAEAEIPGVSQNDLEVYAVGNQLTIKGSRRPREGQNIAYHRHERGAGEFTRVVALPIDVDTANVQASLKNGVLTITLPKSEAAKAKRITVKTN